MVCAPIDFEQFAVALSAFVPLMQTALWFALIAGAFIVLRLPLCALLAALEDRLRKGGSVKIGDIELGGVPLVTKTADLADAAKEGSLKLYGNPDRFVLLFKARTESWSNSTKAMQLPTGCIVQVTNEQRQADGTWVAAEALAFAPGVSIHEEEGDEGRYLA